MVKFQSFIKLWEFLSARNMGTSRYSQTSGNLQPSILHLCTLFYNRSENGVHKSNTCVHFSSYFFFIYNRKPKRQPSFVLIRAKALTSERNSFATTISQTIVINYHQFSPPDGIEIEGLSFFVWQQQVNDIISDKWTKSIISRSKTNLFSSNQYHLSRRESTFFLYLFPNSKYRGKLSIAYTSFLSFITKAFSNYVFYWIFFALFRIRIRLPVTDNTLFINIVVEILAVSARTLGLICTKIGDTIKRLEQICH